MAILKAIVAKARTGEGQKVETSQLGATISFQHFALTPALKSGKQRDDGKPPMTQADAVFYFEKCKDGKWMMIVPVMDKQWESTCEVFGLQDLYKKYPTLELRNNNKDEIRPQVLACFKEKPFQEWFDLMNAKSVPVAPINNYSDLAKMQHMRDNNYIKRQEIPGFGQVDIVGYPIDFHGTPVPYVHGDPPEAGEHTDEYLKKVGFSDGDITNFAAAGAIRDTNRSKL